MEDAEKAELMNCLLCFSLQCQGRHSGIPGPRGKRGSLQRGWPSLGWGGLCERSLKQSGHPQIHGPWWNAPTSTEGAGGCHCWSTLHHLWKVLEDRRGAHEYWRKASVTPVFKKGRKEDPENYRMVSLTTSIPGKITEQLILEVINKQVEEKKVIRSSQHGFTKGKIMLDQSDRFLWWHDWLGRSRESSRCCLPRLQQGFRHCLP